MFVDTDPDLTAIDRELRDVEAALSRLDDGTYWTDERTGEPLDEALLAENPLLRSAAPPPPTSPTPSAPPRREGW